MWDLRGGLGRREGSRRCRTGERRTLHRCGGAWRACRGRRRKKPPPPPSPSAPGRRPSPRRVSRCLSWRGAAAVFWSVSRHTQPEHRRGCITCRGWCQRLGSVGLWLEVWGLGFEVYSGFIAARVVHSTIQDPSLPTSRIGEDDVFWKDSPSGVPEKERGDSGDGQNSWNEGWRWNVFGEAWWRRRLVSEEEVRWMPSAMFVVEGEGCKLL